MPDTISYPGPASDRLTDDDVRAALDFLIAVEPEPEPGDRTEYEARTRRFAPDIARAELVLTGYARQLGPFGLAAMRRAYYGFTNDPRYLASGRVSSIVTSALNAAWADVGSWRR